MKPGLSIVIVSWNTRDLLRTCLSSIYQETNNLPLEVFVVDNASADGCADMVESEFPEVHLIKNKENLGYGRANNQALRQCQGKYVLMLNPDTVIIENAIGKLIDFMNENSRVGMTGPKTVHPDGTIQVSWALFPRISTIFTNNVPWKEALSMFGIFKKFFKTNSIYSEKGYTLTTVIKRQRVDYLLGEFMLTRKEVLDSVGLFDEKIFMYEEETDLCYRIYKNKWEIWFVPEAEIIHHEKKSIKQLPNYVECEVDWFLTGRAYFYQKHFGQSKKLLFHIITFLSSCLKLIIFQLYFLSDHRKSFLRERIKWHGTIQKWYLRKLINMFRK